MQKYLRVDVAFAVIVALLVLTAGYFVDRGGDIDELGLFNPSYMLLHYGKLTYPVHGYFDQPVIVHPPVHVGLVGLLLKLGFTWYYAEATPAVVWYLLVIAVIVCGPFPVPVRLGLLFAVGFVVSSEDWLAVQFGMRPEGEVNGAWFAGLLLLESGRLRNWNRNLLFAGAALVTFAATVHYYAWPAVAGFAVYAIWACRDLGWKPARGRIAAVAGGACVAALPFAAFFLIPNFSPIRAAISSSALGGIFAAVQAHMEIYRAWVVHDFPRPLPHLMAAPLGWGIPLILYSTAGLSLFRSTRGIVFAALPWELCIFFLASYKQRCYLIHEVLLFVAALCVSLLMAGDWLAGRHPSPITRKVYTALAALLLSIYLISDNRMLMAAGRRTQPGLHEADLARAANLRILGPNARVVGRIGGWYSSGAAAWHDVTDILIGSKSYDPKTYFSAFDAAVDYYHRSGDPIGGSHTISSWYAEGLLHLRGFYIGETNAELHQLLLSAKPAAAVAGYASRDGRLRRFDETSDGDHEVQSFLCPSTAPFAAQLWRLDWSGMQCVALELPNNTGSVVTTLSPRSSPEVATAMRTCRPLAAVRGSLVPADRDALLDAFRREDRPIRFYRNFDDLAR